MADFIYGGLEDRIQPVEYRGTETDTAIVRVNEDTKRIFVDVKKLTPGILTPEVELEAAGKYYLTAEVTDGEGVNYSWTRKENVQRIVKEAIDNYNEKVSHDEREIRREILDLEAKLREDIKYNADILTKALKEEEARSTALIEEQVGAEKERAEATERAISQSISEIDSSIATLNAAVAHTNLDLADLRSDTTDISNTMSDEITERKTVSAAEIKVEYENDILSTSIYNVNGDLLGETQEITIHIPEYETQVEESENAEGDTVTTISLLRDGDVTGDTLTFGTAAFTDVKDYSTSVGFDELKEEFNNFKTETGGNFDFVYGQLTEINEHLGNVEDEVHSDEEDMSTIEGRVTAVEGRATALENRADADEDKISDIDERLTTAEENIETLQTDLDSTKTDLDETKQRVTTNENEISALQDNSTVIESNITALEGRMTQAEEDISENKANIESNTENIEELQEKIKDLDGAMHYVGVSTTDPITEGATIPGYESAFKDGDVCLYTDEEEKEYIYANGAWAEFGDTGDLLTKDEFRETIAEYSTTEQMTEAITEAVTAAEEEIKAVTDALDERLTTAEGSIESLQTDLEAAQQDITTVQSDLATYEESADAEIEGIKTNVSTLQAEVSEAKDDITSIKESLATEGSDITSLEERLATAESDIVDLQTDTTGLRTDVSDLQTTTSDLESTSESLTTRVSDIETQIEGLTGAMRFIGVSTTDPLSAEGPTIEGHTGDFEAGDMCIYDNIEYVYDGNTWTALGGSGDYLTKTEAAEEYLRQEDAEETYLKKSDAESEYVSKGTLDEYLTKTEAEDIYATTEYVDEKIKDIEVDIDYQAGKGLTVTKGTNSVKYDFDDDITFVLDGSCDDDGKIDGLDKVSTEEELIKNLIYDGGVYLTDDISMTTADLQEALNQTECEEVTINTGDSTLTFTDNEMIVMNGVKSFTIEGKIEAETYPSNRAIFNMYDGESFYAKDLTATLSGMLVQPLSYSYVEIDGCDLTSSGYYILGTNSIGSDAHSEVVIKNSTITMNPPDGDSAAILINNICDCTIEDTTINGTRQGVIARAGNVTITDSTIDVEIGYDGGVSRCTAPLNWSSGNEVAYGALVCGTNSSSTGYKADAIVNVTNTTLKCTIAEGCAVDENRAYALYAIGNLNPRTDGEEGNYKTEITFDNVTVEGNIFIGGTTQDETIDCGDSSVTFIEK